MLAMSHPQQTPGPRSHSRQQQRARAVAAEVDDILEMAEQVIIEQEAATSASQMNVSIIDEVPSSMTMTPAAIEDRYQLHQRLEQSIDNDFNHLLFQAPLSPPAPTVSSHRNVVDSTDFHKPGGSMMSNMYPNQMQLPFPTTLAESLLAISPSQPKCAGKGGNPAGTASTSGPPTTISVPNGISQIERVDEMLDEILEMAENVLEDSNRNQDIKTLDATSHVVVNLAGQDVDESAPSTGMVTPPVSQARKRGSGTMMDMSTNGIQETGMVSPFEDDYFNCEGNSSKRVRLTEPLTTNKDVVDCKAAEKIPFDVFSSTMTSPSLPRATSIKDKWRFRGYQCDIWKERFEELIEYREKYGHCLVPHNWAGNVALAQWVKRQRYQYKLLQEGKHSTMSVERMDILNSMGFVWDSHKVSWEEKFVQLQQYSARHGHCNVSGKLQENRPLSIWVKCQRRQRKLMERNEKSTMTADRIQRLDELGFDWNPRNL